MNRPMRAEKRGQCAVHVHYNTISQTLGVAYTHKSSILGDGGV